MTATYLGRQAASTSAAEAQKGLQREQRMRHGALTLRAVATHEEVVVGVRLHGVQNRQPFAVIGWKKTRRELSCVWTTTNAEDQTQPRTSQTAADAGEAAWHQAAGNKTARNNGRWWGRLCNSKVDTVRTSFHQARPWQSRPQRSTAGTTRRGTSGGPLQATADAMRGLEKAVLWRLGQQLGACSPLRGFQKGSSKPILALRASLPSSGGGPISCATNSLVHVTTWQLL